MSYKLVIKPEVFEDIQQAIDWYNSRQKGLGEKFFNAVQQEYNNIRKNPGYQIRYDNIRCLPVRKFAFMIHFFVQEKSRTVIIMGVISTYRDPATWKKSD